MRENRPDNGESLTADEALSAIAASLQKLEAAITAQAMAQGEMARQLSRLIDSVDELI